MNIIEYENISLSYGDVKVINNISLKIQEGEFITIIGSSGCGKSTLLKMVNGLIVPSSGKVLIKGQYIKDLDIINHRRKIGYVIQGNGLFPHMTVEKNITYVSHLYKKNKKKDFKDKVKKLMSLVGLDYDLHTRRPKELSGGQQQRVAIARALSSKSNILLMDEPFSAVDEITRSSLQDEIKKIHSETKSTILFVTHDINEALKLGNKVLVMNNGEVLQFDTPENIVKSPKDDFVERLVGNSSFRKS